MRKLLVWTWGVDLHEQVQFMKSPTAYTSRGPSEMWELEVEEDANFNLLHIVSSVFFFFFFFSFSWKQSATSGELLANQV